MSGLLDWIKEEEPKKPSEPPVYLLVRVPNRHHVRHVRQLLHEQGGAISDIPLFKDGRSWPYITDGRGAALNAYTTVEGIFDSIMNYARRRATTQRDFVRVGAR